MIVASYLLLFLIALFILYSLTAAFCTWCFFKTHKVENRFDDESLHLPPVSVIKPIAGEDRAVIENIAGFCDQNYPHYEIVLASTDDIELTDSVYQELRRRFPTQRIKQVKVEDNCGPNYKVGNLIGGIENARYDTVVISDSDMRVGKNYLRTVAAELNEKNVGVVTCLYRTTDIRNCVAALQALTLLTDFIPNVLLDRQMQGLTYGFGATLCTRKKIIKRAGGLEPLLNYLADDYQLANRIHRQGYRIALSSYFPDHICNDRTFKTYFDHQLRWAITQRVCRPWGYLASLITHGTFLAFLYLILTAFSKTAIIILITVILVRISGFLYLNVKLLRHFETLPWFWLIPANDLINSLLWLLSLFKNTVVWKKCHFRVLRDGRIAK